MYMNEEFIFYKKELAKSSELNQELTDKLSGKSNCDILDIQLLIWLALCVYIVQQVIPICIHYYYLYYHCLSLSITVTVCHCLSLSVTVCQVYLNNMLK